MAVAVAAAAGAGSGSAREEVEEALERDLARALQDSRGVMVGEGKGVMSSIAAI